MTCVPPPCTAAGENCTRIGAAGATAGKAVCKPGPPQRLSKTQKNCLVIGDSVSLGYTPFLATMLEKDCLLQHAPFGGDGTKLFLLLSFLSFLSILRGSTQSTVALRTLRPVLCTFKLITHYIRMCYLSLMTSRAYQRWCRRYGLRSAMFRLLPVESRRPGCLSRRHHVQLWPAQRSLQWCKHNYPWRCCYFSRVCW